MPLTARQRAKAACLMTYEADKPCRKCNTFERYTASGHCVACRRERYGLEADRAERPAINAAEIETRQQARQAGARTYQTHKPCAWSHAKRFTISGHCVACTRQWAIDLQDVPDKLERQRQKAAERQARRRARLKAKATPGMPANRRSPIDAESSSLYAQIINLLLTCNV